MNKTYKLFIRKYNIFANDYIVEERIVNTHDIYHTIGKIYCTTIEEIKRISYMELKDSDVDEKWDNEYCVYRIGIN